MVWSDRRWRNAFVLSLSVAVLMAVSACRQSTPPAPDGDAIAPSGSQTASDHSSLSHPETSDQPAVEQDAIWQRSDVVTSGGFVTQSGYVVASADEDVVFASGAAGRRKRAITAVRGATGETFWERTDLGGDPYVQFAEPGGVAVNFRSARRGPGSVMHLRNVATGRSTTSPPHPPIRPQRRPRVRPSSSRSSR